MDVMRCDVPHVPTTFVALFVLMVFLIEFSNLLFHLYYANWENINGFDNNKKKIHEKIDACIF